MKWEGFQSLDLSNIEQAGPLRLAPGEYVAVAENARVESIGETNNKRLVVEFVDSDGAGDVRTFFNLVHTSEQAQTIGHRQLKTFLTAAAHPNPDRPGDVETINGLTCRITVGMGKEWKDRDGNTRKNAEVKRWLPVGEVAPQKKAEKLDDEIPF